MIIGYDSCFTYLFLVIMLSIEKPNNLTLMEATCILKAVSKLISFHFSVLVSLLLLSHSTSNVTFGSGAKEEDGI